MLAKPPEAFSLLLTTVGSKSLLNEASSLLNLEGRHFLVTGAASGIGRSTAKLLNALGAGLTLVDINKADLAIVANSLLKTSAVFQKSFDLADTFNIERLVALCAQDAGPINGFVHCAGIQQINPVRTLSIESWRKMFLINCEAGLMLAKCLSSRKIYAGENGAFVFVSSVVGVVGSSGAVAYSTSKAALHGMARSLALELSERRIRVNCVAPGFVKTPMYERVESNWNETQRGEVEASHPLGIGLPEDIANAIAFLIADTGRWITGQVLVVDGGYSAK